MKTREQFTLKGPININQNTREILEVLLDIRDIALNKLTKEEKAELPFFKECIKQWEKEGGFPNTKEECNCDHFKEVRNAIWYCKVHGNMAKYFENELPDPLSNYKAKLKERINYLDKYKLHFYDKIRDVFLVEDVLDLIDKE